MHRGLSSLSSSFLSLKRAALTFLYTVGLSRQYSQAVSHASEVGAAGTVKRALGTSDGKP